MQVITGKYKGMKLNSLEGMNTRPTSARIKQNMFNILDNYFIFENKASLDIFGGSGALTVEAISRGIDKAIINDHYSDAIKVIKSNLDRLKEDNYEILQYDYEQLLEVVKNRGTKFDLIFLDPPFKHLEYYYEVFEKVINYNILNNWGVIIAQSEKELDTNQIYGLKLLKYKQYKNKHLYIYRMEN